MQTGMLRTLAVGVAALALACHRPDSYLPSEIVVVTVVATPTTIPADGVATTTIRAAIDRDADRDQRTVTFRTTAGSFLPLSDERPREATVTANGLGVATIELKSEFGKSSALVEATIGGTTASVRVTFTQPAAADVFALAAALPNLPADGFSETVVSAQLRRSGLTDTERRVQFQTTAGSLRALGRVEGSPTGTSVTAIADTDGLARVALISSQQTGSARVTATALGFSQQVEVSFVPAQPADTITVSTAPANQVADNDSLVTVHATIAAGIPTPNRKVTFATTLGEFVGGSEDTAGIDNRARVFLKSSKIGRAVVTATVNGTRADTTVDFRAALPDRIAVLPQGPIVEANAAGAIEIKARLLRDQGNVSDDLLPVFSAIADNGQSIGTFTAVSLSKSGDVSAQFRPGPTAYRGPVTIRVTVPGSGASGTATVVVVDP